MTVESTTQTTDTQTANQESDGSSGSALSTADLASTNSSSTGGTPSGQMDANTQVETRSSDDQSAPLFGDHESSDFRERWTEIQAAFVDDPRKAVEQADSLVAETIQRLAQVFADERNGLESQWSSGQDVSTEDLRVALRRYRSFFDRLLTV